MGWLKDRYGVEKRVYKNRGEAVPLFPVFAWHMRRFHEISEDFKTFSENSAEFCSAEFFCVPFSSTQHRSAEFRFPVGPGLNCGPDGFIRIG